MLETNILYRRVDPTLQKMDIEIPFNKIQVGGIIGQGEVGFAILCVSSAFSLVDI